MSILRYYVFPLTIEQTSPNAQSFQNFFWWWVDQRSLAFLLSVGAEGTTQLTRKLLGYIDLNRLLFPVLCPTPTLKCKHERTASFFYCSLLHYSHAMPLVEMWKWKFQAGNDHWNTLTLANSSTVTDSCFTQTVFCCTLIMPFLLESLIECERRGQERIREGRGEERRERE